MFLSFRVLSMKLVASGVTGGGGFKAQGFGFSRLLGYRNVL